jgi:hypothetical protein
MPRRPSASEVEISIARAIGAGVPDRALATYARWWQLETWLRILVYLELMAAQGSAWAGVLSGRALGRWSRDSVNAYMRSPDSVSPLAYLDSGELLELVDRDDLWDLFEPGLVPRVRWRGLMDELMTVRRRSAHCRRPHAEDLGRIERALRDLELGARTVLEAFNEQGRIWGTKDDGVAEAWVGRTHPAAQRLLTHAAMNRATEFELRTSRRPWHGDRDGTLYHAEWRTTEGFFDLRRVWEDDRLDQHRELIVFVCANDPSEASVSFSRADDSARVADAIGTLFDVLLANRVPHLDDRLLAAWDRGLGELDYRLQIKSAVSLAGPDTPFSIFSA